MEPRTGHVPPSGSTLQPPPPWQGPVSVPLTLQHQRTRPGDAECLCSTWCVHGKSVLDMLTQPHTSQQASMHARMCSSCCIPLRSSTRARRVIYGACAEQPRERADVRLTCAMLSKHGDDGHVCCRLHTPVRSGACTASQHVPVQGVCTGWAHGASEGCWVHSLPRASSATALGLRRLELLCGPWPGPHNFPCPCSTGRSRPARTRLRGLSPRGHQQQDSATAAGPSGTGFGYVSCSLPHCRRARGKKR